MLDIDPKNRPSAEELIQNEYVKEILEKLKIEKQNKKFKKKLKLSFKGQIFSRRGVSNSRRNSIYPKSSRNTSKNLKRSSRKIESAKSVKKTPNSQVLEVSREAKKQNNDSFVAKVDLKKKSETKKLQRKSRESIRNYCIQLPKSKQKSFGLLIPNSKANSIFEEKEVISFELSLSEDEPTTPLKKCILKTDKSSFKASKRTKKLKIPLKNSSKSIDLKTAKKNSKITLRNKSKRKTDYRVKSYRVVPAKKMTSRISIIQKSAKKIQRTNINRHNQIKKLQNQLNQMKKESMQIKKIRNGSKIKSRLPRKTKKSCKKKRDYDRKRFMNSPNLNKQKGLLNLEHLYKADPSKKKQKN